VTGPDRKGQPGDPGEWSDPVGLAVLSHRLDSIVAKMQNTLLRTARSGVINNGRDFSCCILTADARLIAVGESLPIHVMVGPDLMARSMLELHPRLRPGDAFLHNSPYHGCSHPADQSILVPVIDQDGVHRFTVLAKAHQADIGNAQPTTYVPTARDVYEEGALIFPAVKIQADYRDIDDIVRLCLMRIRVPEQWRGDYLAALGAARVGERELLAVGAELGWDRLLAFVEAWLDYSEQRMVAALRRLPSGRVVGVSVHDPFPGTPPEGLPVTAMVTVDREAARVEVDLRENPDCLACGLNLSEATARTTAAVGVFNGIGTVVPPNAGSLRRLTVDLRENCVVGIPRHPTSCSMATTNLADRVINAVQRSLAQLADGFGMAEHGAIMVASDGVISGRDPRRGGASFVNQVILGQTLGGAGPAADGWLTILTPGTGGMGFWDSVEVDELRQPILVHERRLLPDSEGAGRFRGSPALRVEFGPVDEPMEVIFAVDGRINGPLGARGGLPGATARNYHRLTSSELVELGALVHLRLGPGESVVGISCGGGGYGPPIERDPARVRHDVEEGYVTRERAERLYGVVLDAGGAVDSEATCRRREKMRALTPQPVPDLG
jgi:N-methylhydantoinase B/oxoprolinase/acetone carboxylase alpha subunit